MDSFKRSRLEPETVVVEVPNSRLGWIIGRGGETIAEIRRRTGCDIQLPAKNQTQSPNGVGRIALRNGDVEEARLLIKRLAAEKPLRPVFVGKEVSNVSKLYVDILNFVDSHFFRDQDDWAIGPVLLRVQSFVESARSSGVALVVFIDAVRTDEALDKWRDRMTKSVLQGKRSVPQNISGIMAELCLRAGVEEVRLSTAVNNDDTMASYSAYDHVPVLSGDKDFLRYVYGDDDRPCQLDLYSDFLMKNSTLLLSPRDSSKTLEGETRVLIESPPEFHRHGLDEDAWVQNLSVKRAFRGGAPTPLVRTLGFNPYIAIRPLRIALYGELLKESTGQPVREEFPLWDAELRQVVFPIQYVNIPASIEDDPNFHLLQNPKEAFRSFFPRECDSRSPPGISQGDWYRHCHGCKVIVIELCCYLPKNKERGMNFLDVLIESDQW